MFCKGNKRVSKSTYYAHAKYRHTVSTSLRQYVARQRKTPTHTQSSESTARITRQADSAEHAGNDSDALNTDSEDIDGCGSDKMDLDTDNPGEVVVDSDEEEDVGMDPGSLLEMQLNEQPARDQAFRESDSDPNEDDNNGE